MKAIFLDIDGPMIPDAMFLLHRNASFGHHFSPVSIGILKAILAQDLEVRIVTNSVHNVIASELRASLISAGIPANGFAHDYHTKFPNVGPRLLAIQTWMEGHPNFDKWVAFDDEPILSPNAFLVDPDCGLNLAAFNHAARIFNFKPRIVL